MCACACVGVCVSVCVRVGVRLRVCVQVYACDISFYADTLLAGIQKIRQC